ncbi:lantibiotic dehydratase C-terminal domain-containing protein [Kitasatospora sp. NPDC059646]|uniref:lantibiotic dehydratase C-terminal domain-containing protein n=1 Tax=Kitasatospora sp. NPDC059646 TaxID=3346893 RepID=UPI00368A83C2
MRSVSDDRQLALDPTDPHHRARPHHVRPRDGEPFGPEAPGQDAGRVGGQAGGLGFPLPRRAPGGAPAAYATPSRDRTVRESCGPGSEWLSPGCPARRDEPAVHHLPSPRAELARAVDRWFWLRHPRREPHPQVRLPGGPAVLAARLLPVLADWADRPAAAALPGPLTPDSYRPALERHGGAAAIETVEQVLAADSRCRLPRERRPGGPPLSSPPPTMSTRRPTSANRHPWSRHRITERHTCLPHRPRVPAPRGRYAERLTVRQARPTAPTRHRIPPNRSAAAPDTARPAHRTCTTTAHPPPTTRHPVRANWPHASARRAAGAPRDP